MTDFMTNYARGYYDQSYPPSILTPPPPITPATGATAGTPGTWTPAGSTPPASVADLIAGVPNAVGANPATAWTTGQYVDCGDGADAYWNGAAWVAGIAVVTATESAETAPADTPAVDEQQVQEPAPDPGTEPGTGGGPAPRRRRSSP